MRDIIIDTIVAALISSLFIGAGLRFLLAKRPFIVESRWWGIVCIAPLILNSIKILFSEYTWQSRESTFLAYALIGGPAILLGLILWGASGGIAIGATGTTLRDALRQAFSGRGLFYEESAKGFRLPELNNELITRPLADGMFSVHLKRFGGRRAFRQLAPEIKEFFRTAPVLINKRVGYALVVIGVAFLLINSLATYKQLSLHARMRALKESHAEFFKPSEK